MKIFNVVDAAGADDAPLEHHGGEGGVGPGIEENFNVHGGDPPVLHSGPVGAERGVPLGSKFQIFPAVKYAAHRRTGLFRGHRHLAAQDGGKVLLSAEASACHILEDVHILRAAA